MVLLIGIYGGWLLRGYRVVIGYAARWTATPNDLSRARFSILASGGAAIDPVPLGMAMVTASLLLAAAVFIIG